MDDPKAKSLLERHEQRKGERYAFEKNWQDIRDLVRPGASDFFRQHSPSSTRTESIYDGTAPTANKELASGLHSYLTSPADRWFSLEVEDMEQVRDDPDALAWLELVSDIIYTEYNNPITNFNTALAEAYADTGAFGTCIVNQEWNEDAGHIVFRTFPLADCWFEENARGRVDLMDREVEMNKRQLTEMFGEDALPQKIKDDKSQPNRKWCVVHMVYPRKDRDPAKSNSYNMRFASCWVLKDPATILKESGYNSFPYHAARWSTVAGEVYGRGPAIECLPDIKMLNRMEYTILRAAQKIVDPPLQAVSDGYLGQIKTPPGGVIFREPGVEPIIPLETRANIPIGLEMSDRKRNQIRQCFFADWLRLEQKKAEQTAYEVQERIEEKLRMIGPMLGRLQSELLGPKLQRTYELLHEHNKIPPAPVSLQRRKLKVVYISPAARAQKGTKAIAIRRYLETITPFAGVKPEVLDAINGDATAQEFAELLGVSRKVINSPMQIAAIRKERAAQQALATLAETAEPVSKAIKNVAEAQNIGAA